MLFLFATDFDNTVAQTLAAPSPNGIGVEQAYRLACQQVFGQKFELYAEIGELGNRAPTEVINALFEGENAGLLADQARDFLDRNLDSLQGFVPAGKGSSLEWDQKNPCPVITEILVREKLRILCREIGARFPDGRVWPEPCAGFLQFYKVLQIFAKQRPSLGIHVEFGIVSSGHDDFIEKCFDAWQIPRIKLLVTDDLMRSPQCSHIPPEKRVKPQTGPFEMLREACRREFGSSSERASELYIGDSQKTDGGLAKNLGISFIWFNPACQNTPSFADNCLSISNWQELLPVLQPLAIEMAQNGASVFQILHEVFRR